MIVTVTANPAVDVTYEVDALVPGRSLRVSRVWERPGGKGLNVSRVLRGLGEPTLAVAPLGGPTGRWIARSLTGDGHRLRAVPVDGTTRRTLTVVGADTTVLNEPGPRLSADELAALTEAVRDALTGARALVLSGSLPPGAPDDLYAELVRVAARARVPAVVDAAGPALLAAAAAGAAVVKPNAAELRATTGGCGADAARRLLRAGARSVVVSLGSRGLLAFHGDRGWRADAVPGVTGNPTGAGDAAAAAIALGTAAADPWPRTLARAAALGAAAVLAPTAGEADPRAYRVFLPTVHVEEYA